MKKIILTVLLASIIPVSAMDFGVGANIGTLGYGGNLNLQINEYVQTRLQLNTLSAAYEETIQGYNVRYEYDEWSYGGLVDIHPFGGNFRLSAGMIKMGNIDIIATPRNPSSSLNKPYTTESSFKPSPYFGFGFGSVKKGLSMQFDIGVIFQSYEVNFKDNSFFVQAPNTSTQNQIKERLDLLQIYPVISLSIVYGF